MKIFNNTQYQYNKNNTPHRHAELVSASNQSAKPCPTFGLSNKSMQALPSGKTLKQVQGDNYLAGNTANPSHCHAELGSASDQSTKLHPTFGLSGKSMQAIPMGKTLKQVQGDSSLCAYTKRDSLYFHPNINYRISFGALKKNQFDGIDLAVVEKFKAPIEKFNSNDDLQNWAKGQAESIANTDFGGRQKETQIQRKAMLKEWTDYIFKENDAYNNATALLILNAITKDLKPDNDKLPPVLNKGVLADCISEIAQNTKADKKYQFDLNKMYETKLRAIYLEDTKVENGNTGWVVIPSKVNDPEHFEQNVEKLKTLSHKNWCTKSFNAEPYLSQGDFHVYLEDGQPKLGVRFVGDEIQEIQGEKNDSKIPISYFDEAKRHIDKNGLMLTSKAKDEIEAALKVKAEMDKIKADLREAIESNDVKAIFNYFNISAEEDEDGFLTISKYRLKSQDFTFSDLGIDEDKLLEKVKRIEGCANFRNSQVTNLSNLESIGGEACFVNSKVKSLENLKSIGDYATFRRSQVTNLNNLESIGGDAFFNKSMVTNLSKLKSIGGSADFRNSKVTNLDKLKSIGEDADFRNSNVANVDNIESIGGDADFSNSQIENLKKLKFIGGQANFKSSKVTDLESLEYIGDDAFFGYNRVNLGKLKTIKGRIFSEDKQFKLKLTLQCLANRIFSNGKE